MRHTMIAMSGGVDSSVAALLRKEAQDVCVGATMRLRSTPRLSLCTENSCGGEQDIADAKAVCERLGIPHTVYDFSDRFEAAVVAPFVQTYLRGQTPNPCVNCNRSLKFSALFEEMQKAGCDTLATGHYARVEYDAARGRYLLKRAIDESKDQSYVLYMLTQEQLSHLLLPLGTYTKPQIRALAENAGFATANKQDSQDICFIPDGDYAAFIRCYTGHDCPAGTFVGETGERLGVHKGIIHYTIGQHKGLGLVTPEPLYVLRLCPEENTVVLGKSESLFTRTVLAQDVNLIACTSLKEKRRIQAKIRYRQAAQDADAWQDDAGILHVCFEEPQRAATPGQAVVLYEEDTVLGGGTICASEKESE